MAPVVFLLRLRIHFVTTNTSVTTSQNNTHSVFLTVQVFLSEVCVAHRVTHENNRTSFIYDFNRLIITSDDSDNIVIEYELSRTYFMALRSSYYRSSIELTIISHIVEIVFSTIILDGSFQFTQCFLCSDDCSLLSISSCLYVRDQV